MLIVTAKAVVKEGTQDSFIEAATKCVKETRKEAGCVAYDLLRDCFNGNSFTFLEQWESQKHLDDHMKTAHFAAFSEGIQDLLANALTVGVFEADKRN